MSRPAVVVHPFLLALYPPLLLYTRSADSVFPGEVLPGMAVVLLGTAATWAVLRRVRDAAWAGLVTSAALFCAFSFERNVYALATRGILANADAREAVVLALGLGLLGGWVALVTLRPGLVPVLNNAANAGAAALLALLVPSLVGAVRSLPPPVPAARVAVPARSPAARRDPDIYFLVLDAYGRSDVLRSLYGFDNEPFLTRMERRGFYVAHRSTANYCQTALSVSATLGGRYHDRDPLAGSDATTRLPFRSEVGANALAATLAARGYRLRSFATGFAVTDDFPSSDRSAPAGDLTEYNSLLLDMTPAPTLLGRGAGRGAHARHRARIVHAFDHLPDAAGAPGPTFTFAHVVAPHPPFVFDRDGADVSEASPAYRLTDGKPWTAMEGHGDSADYAARYRAQAAYIGDRVEAAVDAILARSPTPPVILIQGDHGPGSHFDPDDPNPNDLDERFGILNLALIPGGADRLFYPTITPVNTFRLLCDHLFGTDRGPLPDRNYYSSYRSPYRLVEVTSEVAGAAETTRAEDSTPTR